MKQGGHCAASPLDPPAPLAGVNPARSATVA